jgi:hypothetical protein
MNPKKKLFVPLKELASLKELLIPLEELDTLTDLFSFFTSFDSSVSRQVCKWWKDLLQKDTLGVKQTHKNDRILYNFLYSSDIMREYAAYYGYLDILTWIKADNMKVNNFVVCKAAAEGGQLKLLKWCQENSIIADVCIYAGACGHLKVMKWLKNSKLHSEKVCYLKNNLGSTAARYGKLNILKWMRENKYEFGSYTCSWASSGGHLDTLIWLREECKIPWKEDTCDYSKSYGRIQTYIHSLPLEDQPCRCKKI